MLKPHLFVSCGQRTDQEKLLGDEVCGAIREHGVFDCFFAEAQHNLNGLHENIFDALAKSDGFITIIHRRGNVSYGPDKREPLDRASVWIEQEIAIAAYIQRTAKNDLLTAAYIEKGVGREGLRELLHLNPLEFTSNDQIIADLKARLDTWHMSSGRDNSGELNLEVLPGREGSVQVKRLTPILTNKGKRASEYSCTIEVPEVLLSFAGSTTYMLEVSRRQPRFRRFQATEKTKRDAPLMRDDPVRMLTLDVAIANLNPAQHEEVLTQNVFVSAEIENRTYSLTKRCAEIFTEAQPAMKEEIEGPDAKYGYFHFKSKPDKPLCPKCYQSVPSKTVYMGPRDQRAGGIMRFCPVCDFTVTEEVARPINRQVKYDPYSY
ncbi:MAG: hypothetical protein ACLGXA_00180 [Acidobacteriota bacterium]